MAEESDSQALRDLNAQIGEHERKGDDAAQAFFGDVLAEDLIFRRAGGTVVTKQQYLTDLKPDAYETLDWTMDEPQIYEDEAVVTVLVTAKRRGEEREKPGRYRNVRRFVRRRGRWQLVAWLNTELKE